MRVRDQIFALTPDNKADLGVGFPIDKAEDDLSARAFQLAGKLDVRGLVEACLQFNQRCHGLAVLRRLAKRLHDGAVLGRTVKRLLDGDHVRIACGLTQKFNHRLEALVGVVEQHILLANCREDVAIMIAHTLRQARLVRHPGQFAPIIGGKLAEIGDADDARDLNQLGGLDLQTVNDQVLQNLGRVAVHFQPDGPPFAAAFQGGLELAHQIFSFLFDLDVRIAKHPEHAASQWLVSGEKLVERQHQ